MGLSTLPDHALDRLYPWPRPNWSLEDYYRAHHRDLAALTDLDLDREAFGVASRLYRDRDPGRVAWLLERRDAVRAERHRRASVAQARSADASPVAIDWGRISRRCAVRPRLTVRRGGALVEL